MAAAAAYCISRSGSLGQKSPRRRTQAAPSAPQRNTSSPGINTGSAELLPRLLKKESSINGGSDKDEAG